MARRSSGLKRRPLTLKIRISEEMDRALRVIATEREQSVSRIGYELLRDGLRAA